MSLLERGDLFVDVGANVGLFAAAVASTGHLTGVEVLALEPHPDTFRRLQANLQGYSCARAEQLAASNRAAVVRMAMPEDQSSAKFAVVGQDMNGIDVKAVRLDHLLTRYGNRRLIVKVDVEGHEREVLDGLGSVLTPTRIGALLIDGFRDLSIPHLLRQVRFRLYDPANLTSYDTGTALLAVAESAVLG